MSAEKISGVLLPPEIIDDTVTESGDTEEEYTKDTGDLEIDSQRRTEQSALKLASENGRVILEDWQRRTQAWIDQTAFTPEQGAVAAECFETLAHFLRARSGRFAYIDQNTEGSSLYVAWEKTINNFIRQMRVWKNAIIAE